MATGLAHLSYNDLVDINTIKRDLLSYSINFRTSSIEASMKHSAELLEEIWIKCPLELAMRCEEVIKKIGKLPKEFEVVAMINMKQLASTYGIEIKTSRLVEEKTFCMQTLKEIEAKCPEDFLVSSVRVMESLGHSDIFNRLDNEVKLKSMGF